MNERYSIPAFLMQISLGGVLCALSYILISGGQPPAGYFPGVLLIFGPLVYVANRLFLSRDRTILSMVAMNAALALLMIGSVQAVCGWSQCGGIIPVGILTIVSTIRGAQLNLNPPRLNGAILWMEVSVFTLAIFIGIWAALGNAMIWSIPAALGAVASLLAVIAHRMDQILGFREWMLLLLAFSLMGGVLWVLIAFLAAPAGQGVVAAWSGLMAILKLIGGGVQRLMLFLSSFIQPESYETLELETGEGGAMNFSESDSSNPMIGVILAVALAVLIAAAAIAAIIVFGRQRLGRQKVLPGRKRAEKRKRPSFAAALQRLIAGILSRVRFRCLLWKRRNTVTGTYYYLERVCRRTAWKRRAGETPRVFLTRLLDACPGRQNCSAALESLIPLVDRALFRRGCSAEEFPQAKLLRSGIKKAVHRSEERSRE